MKEASLLSFSLPHILSLTYFLFSSLSFSLFHFVKLSLILCFLSPYACTCTRILLLCFCLLFTLRLIPPLKADSKPVDAHAHTKVHNNTNIKQAPNAPYDRSHTHTQGRGKHPEKLQVPHIHRRKRTSENKTRVAWSTAKPLLHRSAGPCPVTVTHPRCQAGLCHTYDICLQPADIY